jgi:hypothetical protein
LENGNTKTVDLSDLNDTASIQAVQAALAAHIAADGDTDASNEIQDLSYDSATQILRITNNGAATDINLSALNNAGTDDQNLSLIGNTLTLENGGSVDLTPYLDNTDNQIITNFTLEANNTVTLTLENGNTKTIDLSNLDNNGTDDQQLSSAVTTPNETVTVSLENGGSTLINIQDSDSNSSNELNTNVALNGTALEVTDAGGVKSVDLDTTFATDTEVATAIVASAALDLDKDNTNEIQTLTSTDGSVTLTQAGNDYDLSVPAQSVTTVANTIAGHKIADYTNESATTVNINETATTLTQQASPNQLDYRYTNESGTATIFRSSPIVSFGKVSGTGALQRGYGVASVTRLSKGKYRVTLANARPTADYTIQLTIVDSNGAGNDDYDISYSNQTTNSFVVQTGDNDNGGGNRAQRDSEFMFTVIDF